MQWSLFLLLLMGPCSFFTFQNYEYLFIDQDMSWDEARKFCRENYTDLAVVNDEADMTRLRKSTDYQKDVWMGLYSESGETQIMWSWTLPETNCDEKKRKGGRNGHLSCRLMDIDSKCKHVKSNKGFCYKEGNQSAKYFLCDTNMTWPEAQAYCNNHHTDPDNTKFTCQTGLGVNGVSGFHTISQLLCNQCMSIGLFRDNWEWSIGSKLSFRYWDNDHMLTDPNGKLCAVTALEKDGKWRTANCSDKKPFFCYDDKVILIKEEKTWEEALDYCRKNYLDLVSITDPQQQKLVQEIAKTASTHFVWLGLRYSCALDMWFWVSDQLVCYDNWRSAGKNDICGMAGAMDKGGGNEWYSRPENDKHNFICAVKHSTD